jgi:hypothetical protein
MLGVADDLPEWRSQQIDAHWMFEPHSLDHARHGHFDFADVPIRELPLFN